MNSKFNFWDQKWVLFQLMYAFNPNQLNQGDDVIINQWEWWSDDIPHDTLCLGTKFVTFRHQNWAISMFRSKRWGIHLSCLRCGAWIQVVCKICTHNFEPFNHGLRRLRSPYEAFFYQNHKLLGMGRQFWLINFGVFTTDSSALILVLWVPCPRFPFIHPFFLKKS